MVDYIVVLDHKENDIPTLDDITKTFNVAAEKIDAHHGIVKLDDVAVTIVTDLETAEDIKAQGAKGKVTGIEIFPDSPASFY